MKFLVLGCNGMAGHTISMYLNEQGHNVIGFARTKSRFVKTVIGNAFDKKKIKAIIRDGRYDSVINCIGVLNIFAEEDKSRAVFINSFLPHYLARITCKMNTQIIHLSTDCVFSGKQGGYKEHDKPDGITFYDRSKALGELDDGKNITFRNSIVGPDLNPEGIGLLNWFLKNTTVPGVSIQGYVKAIWTGQTTLQIAKTIEAASKEKAFGLYNMVPEHSISKGDLLNLFNKYFRDDKVKISMVDGIVADKSLKRTNYNFDYKIPDYEFMVRELAEWTFERKAYYPHYSL